MLAQQIVSGLATGSLYALAALGLVLLYKTTDIVNFAQGEMAMVTTFVSFTFMSAIGMSFGPAFFLALLFAIAFGMITERVIMRPAGKLPHLSQIIITLGLFLIFRGAASMFWGESPRAYPIPVEGEPINVASIVFTPNNLFVVGVTIFLMLGLFLFFKYTKVGLAMRAVAMNVTTSRLMGIKVGPVNSYTWAASAVLGGVAGMLIAPVTFLDPGMMGEVQIKAFAASVLGGFTSLPGAVVGGLLIGVIENLIAGYISAELKTTLIFLLIIIVLYVRPAGLFGTKFVKKV
jgi:branched-chain amino acid transport system permease protein